MTPELKELSYFTNKFFENQRNKRIVFVEKVGCLQKYSEKYQKVKIQNIPEYVEKLIKYGESLVKKSELTVQKIHATMSAIDNLRKEYKTKELKRIEETFKTDPFFN